MNMNNRGDRVCVLLRDKSTKTDSQTRATLNRGESVLDSAGIDGTGRYIQWARRV